MAADGDRTELGRQLNDDKTGLGRQPPSLNLAIETKIFIEKVLVGFSHNAFEQQRNILFFKLFKVKLSKV